MSKRIPQAFIDELVARADIVEVVGRRVTLKKAGREYKANCPFHDEKTPSFTVSPDKGFYHCFGCGEHGTAIGFLMRYDQLAFPEAVEALADMLGVEVPGEDEPTASGSDPRLYELLQAAEALYRRELKQHEVAIDYLKKRGIQGATAARFGLGYAPARWDTVLKALGTTPERRAALMQAGLLATGDRGQQYDRFRDRVMFPIRDARGRTLGFGGRLLGNGEPKYLNSPETPVFHKGRALYGIFEARQAGQGRATSVVVVEGYLDVAMLAQSGIEPVVATLGTATTAEHVRTLTRLADRIVFCFDGDRAGRAAAWRALETLLPYAGGTVEMDFLLLPDGDDPDSFVRREGAQSFRDLLAQSRTLSDFLLEQLLSQVDLGSVDGRARLTALATPLLHRLPNGVYRELLETRLAELVGLPRERFVAHVARDRATPAQPAGARPGTRKSSLIRSALALTLNFPDLAALVEPPQGFDDVDQPGARLLRRLLELCASDPDINAAGLLERVRDDPEGRHLGRLLSQPCLEDRNSALAVLGDTLGRIVEGYRRERRGALLARLADLSPGEQQELRRLSQFH